MISNSFCACESNGGHLRLVCCRFAAQRGAEDVETYGNDSSLWAPDDSVYSGLNQVAERAVQGAA
jgi:hypothetical protein